SSDVCSSDLGALTSHDSHKPSWTNSAEGFTACSFDGGCGRSASCGVHRSRAGSRRPGSGILLLHVAEPAEQGKRGNQKTDSAEDGPRADQTASGSVR